MSIYTGIGSTAKATSKLYLGVDGKARQLSKIYLGVGGTAKLLYASGTPLGSLAVGKVVNLPFGGPKSYKEFLIVHQGIPDAKIYDSSCTGTWLMMKDLYQAVAWHESKMYCNDDENSKVRSWLDLICMMNFAMGLISDKIKEVKIPYRPGGGQDTTVSSGANGLSAKIFLPSATELGVTGNYNTVVPENEGATLAYFKGCNATKGDSRRIAYVGTKAYSWWTRSPACKSTWTYPVYIDTEGGFYRTRATDEKYVRPMIILPSEMLVDPDTMILQTE